MKNIEYTSQQELEKIIREEYKKAVKEKAKIRGYLQAVKEYEEMRKRQFI